MVQWHLGDGPLDTSRQMPRLSIEFDSDQEWAGLLRAYLELPGAQETQGIVVGTWAGEMYDTAPTAVIEALIEAVPRLPALRVLYLGDITFEESEVSWIENTDQSPLYRAYPGLDSLAIRGGNNLRLPGLSLPRLLGLVIETGGMARETVADVLAADLPALTHLQLYLGSSHYGADTTVADLEPLLAGRVFPGLRYLGLQNCEYTDDIAAAISGSPLLERLDVLDLSLGTLTDEGARSLAAAAGVRRLRRLDLSHHYLTEQGMALLGGLGIDVDLSDRQEPYDGERWVAIGE